MKTVALIKISFTEFERSNILTENNIKNTLRTSTVFKLQLFENLF